MVGETRCARLGSKFFPLDRTIIDPRDVNNQHIGYAAPEGALFFAICVAAQVRGRAMALPIPIPCSGKDAAFVTPRHRRDDMQDDRR